MHWQYTPYIIPLVLAAILSTSVALVIWRQHTVETNIAALTMLIIAAWCIGYALEISSHSLSLKILWGKVQYLSIATLPVAWVVFALYFTHQESWLTTGRLVWLSVIPLTTIILVWTNEWHGLIWAETGLATTGPFVSLDVSYGAWFWGHWFFSYVMLMVGTILFIKMLGRTATLYRWQAGLILVAAIAPWVGNGLYITDLTPVPNLDLTPFAFTMSGLALVWGFYRFRLLDILPVAHQAVIQTISDGIILLDQQQRVIEINRTAQDIFQCPERAAIGSTVDKIMPRTSHLLTGDWSQPVQRDFTLADRYFDVRISPFYNHDRLRGYLIVLRDITARKNTEEELAFARDEALAASQLKTQLLANVSHELRTPLNAILGYAEMLQLGIFGSLSKQQNEAAIEIIDSTGQLLNFVNNLLGQAQIEAGRLILNVTAFHPQELLNDVNTVVNALAQTKGINLSYTIEADTPSKLYGDPYWLRQILINLVSNAVKFTEQGTVSVRICQFDTKYWAIQVTDTGYGIPVEAQRYIFEAFRQMDGTVTRAHGGSGLGLSIVKQLVELMGGEVRLESEVGRGSDFTVLFPLTVERDVLNEDRRFINKQ